MPLIFCGHYLFEILNRSGLTILIVYQLHSLDLWVQVDVCTFYPQLTMFAFWSSRKPLWPWISPFPSFSGNSIKNGAFSPNRRGEEWERRGGKGRARSHPSNSFFVLSVCLLWVSVTQKAAWAHLSWWIALLLVLKALRLIKRKVARKKNFGTRLPSALTLAIRISIRAEKWNC